MGKILLNLLLPVIATVIGGIILFHYSTSFSDKDESLLWQLEAENTLTILDADYRSFVISIENSLATKVSNVVLKVTSEKTIEDFQAAATSGGQDLVDLKVTPSQEFIALNIPVLRSSERVTVQIFFKSQPESEVDFFVQADERVAEQRERTDGTVSWLAIAFRLAVYLVYPLIMLFTLRYAMRRLRFLLGSSNDTAFALLHSGARDEAVRLLEQRVSAKGGTVYEVSNLAAAYALDGRSELAKKYFNAAVFLADSSDKGIVLLNSAIIEFALGNREKAIETWEKYRSASPSIAKFYLKHSKLLMEINEAPKEAGTEFQKAMQSASSENKAKTKGEAP